MAAIQTLSDDEIEEFWRELHLTQDGKVTFAELERLLEVVHNFVAPKPHKHHLNHPSRKTSGEFQNVAGDKEAHSSDLHHFLRELMPGCGAAMDKVEFVEIVKRWNIPSQVQVAKTETEDAQAYRSKIRWRRRVRAWWSVKGPEVLFLIFLLALQVAMGLWQLFYYFYGRPIARAALGWGLILAKTCAGILCPTVFFMVLSMSRWFATWARKKNILSRAVNWDYSQKFHVIMACETIFFSCLHAIGHLAGSFVHGSRVSNQDSVAALLGPQAVPIRYAGFIRLTPGWTGVVALACFLLIGLSSAPALRKKSYEIFQYFHLLMYPAFAMLAIHGSARLLTFPMMGFWLVIPVLLVLCERIHRGYLAFFGHYKAIVEALDNGTVVITAEKPEGNDWRAKAGQYVLVQVPDISRFQWHPFTVSTCIHNRLQLHIKADGKWTKQLHALAVSCKETAGTAGDDTRVRICIGIDGPFGAPAQKFYTYDKAIIIGAGIGVTPFSAILTDIEENFRARGDPWQLPGARKLFDRSMNRSSLSGNAASLSTPLETQITAIAAAQVEEKSTGDNKTQEERQTCLLSQGMRKSRPGSTGVRRVDFHWSVREKNDFLWFSDLLNRASALAAEDLGEHLTLNLHPHITGSKKAFSVYVFWYLLDRYRTKEHPESALTGLRSNSHFGRPDFPTILDQYYEDMVQQGWNGRVGVFFCGPPIIGEVLADCCKQLTARAHDAGHRMRFVMHIEVFG